MNPDETFLLIRSARRTLALEIRPDAMLVVRAPRRLRLGLIHDFIAGHRDWIDRKKTAVLSRPRPKPKTYRDGENFLFEGRECRLKLVEKHIPRVELRGADLCLSRHTLAEAQETLEAWYRAQAREIFTRRLGQRSALMNCYPAGLRITSPRRRWGSCGPTDWINLNWRLVMAPPEIADYVIIHELAHLRHRGHGQDFWALVERYCPDFRSHRRWLKENGHVLEV